MSPQPIPVAVLGTGPIADRIATRIAARRDLTLTGRVGPDATPPAGSACAVYLPTRDDLGSGAAAARITALLRSGIDVVSTTPTESLRGADLLGACRAGSSTFHGTGGFEGRLITRFSRAFASITRNLRDVELIEELDLDEPSLEDARALEGQYVEGLRSLSDAVFGDRGLDATVTSDASRVRDEGTHRSRTSKDTTTDQVIVRRTLGERIAYDSIWSRRSGSGAPLRYRLNSRSADAIGHVSIRFHAGDGLHPADHLTIGGILDAIAPLVASAPGVLHHELGIHRVTANPCVSR